MPISRSTSPALIWLTMPLLSPGAAKAHTQLVLLSSRATQHISRVSMFVVIGGAPVLITLSDPQERARFGAIPLHRIYYDATMRMGADDPSNAEKTRRVLPHRLCH